MITKMLKNTTCIALFLCVLGGAGCSHTSEETTTPAEMQSVCVDSGDINCVLIADEQAGWIANSYQMYGTTQVVTTQSSVVQDKNATVRVAGSDISLAESQPNLTDAVQVKTVKRTEVVKTVSQEPVIEIKPIEALPETTAEIVVTEPVIETTLTTELETTTETTSTSETTTEIVVTEPIVETSEPETATTEPVLAPVTEVEVKTAEPSIRIIKEVVVEPVVEVIEPTPVVVKVEREVQEEPVMYKDDSLAARVAYGEKCHDWEAKSGDTLRSLLMKWGEKSGWTVVWKLDRDYRLEAGVIFRGTYSEVSSAIIRSFARATPAPIGTFYKGNRVLVVNTQEDENAN